MILISSSSTLVDLKRKEVNASYESLEGPSINQPESTLFQEKGILWMFAKEGGNLPYPFFPSYTCDVFEN